MPDQTQINAFIIQQERSNALLEAWADYADSKGISVPAVVCRAVASSSEAALGLLRAE